MNCLSIDGSVLAYLGGIGDQRAQSLVLLIQKLPALPLRRKMVHPSRLPSLPSRRAHQSTTMVVPFQRKRRRRRRLVGPVRLAAAGVDESVGVQVQQNRRWPTQQRVCESRQVGAVARERVEETCCRLGRSSAMLKKTALAEAEPRFEKLTC